ncbi:hypothetical protein ABG067_001598 [Albugo candida]
MVTKSRVKSKHELVETTTTITKKTIITRTPHTSTVSSAKGASDQSANLNKGDDSGMITSITKYVILAMICLLSFSIRLFAVVRYESVSTP